MRRSLKFSIVIVVIITIISLLLAKIKYKDDFHKMQSFSNSSVLIKANQEKIVLDERMRIYFITDSMDYIHFFLFDQKKIVTSNIIGSLKDSYNYFNQNNIYWTYFRKSDKYSLLVGKVNHKEISSVDINDISPTDIKYYDFKGHRLFYSTTFTESPILIRGYSEKGELLYNNSPATLQ